jgi:hypothetical protein
LVGIVETVDEDGLHSSPWDARMVRPSFYKTALKRQFNRWRGLHDLPR